MIREQSRELRAEGCFVLLVLVLKYYESHLRRLPWWECGQYRGESCLGASEGIAAPTAPIPVEDRSPVLAWSPLDHSLALDPGSTQCAILGNPRGSANPPIPATNPLLLFAETQC